MIRTSDSSRKRDDGRTLHAANRSGHKDAERAFSRRIQLRRPIALLGLVWLTSAGCLLCLPVDFQTGAKVRLVDAATGDAITGATITLTAGEFSETMSETSAGRYEGGFGLGGPFVLQIEADGFATRTVEGFESRTDACGLFEFETVELTAG